jgi:hypothetical protein
MIREKENDNTVCFWVSLVLNHSRLSEQYECMKWPIPFGYAGQFGMCVYSDKAISFTEV